MHDLFICWEFSICHISLFDPITRKKFGKAAVDLVCAPVHPGAQVHIILATMRWSRMIWCYSIYSLRICWRYWYWFQEKGKPLFYENICCHLHDIFLSYFSTSADSICKITASIYMGIQCKNASLIIPNADLTAEDLILRNLATLTDLTVCLDKRNASGKIENYQVCTIITLYIFL